MADAYVALGSNLGDRRACLRAGLEGMARRGVEVVAVSSVWETEPVDAPSSPWFLNMAARVRTSLGPRELLDELLDVERALGRRRTARNAPRPLDLDLLLHGEHVCDEPRLVLPHPRMWGRRFVLGPLAEIAPELRDPRSGRTVSEHLAGLADAAIARPVGVLDWP